MYNCRSDFVYSSKCRDISIYWNCDHNALIYELKSQNTENMCVQQLFQSGCAFVPSDQNLQCAHFNSTVAVFLHTDNEDCSDCAEASGTHMSEGTFYSRIDSYYCYILKTMADYCLFCLLFLKTQSFKFFQLSMLCSLAGQFRSVS